MKVGDRLVHVSCQSAVTLSMPPPHMLLHRLHLLSGACSRPLTPLFSPLYPSPSYPTLHGSSFPSSMNSSLSPSVHNLLYTTLTVENTAEHWIPVLHWGCMISLIHVSSNKTIRSFRVETMPSAFPKAANTEVSTWKLINKCLWKRMF